MTKQYSLINCTRSEGEVFTEKISNMDQFNKYVFINIWEIIGMFGKELPLILNR